MQLKILKAIGKAVKALKVMEVKLIAATIQLKSCFIFDQEFSKDRLDRICISS